MSLLSRATLCACFVAGIAACSSAPATHGDARTLGVPLERDVQSLDPAWPERVSITTGQVLFQLYEGLVDYDPETLALQPRLASSWYRSDDGLTWTLALRQDVVFAGSGRPLTADDVVTSLSRGVAVLRQTGEFPELPDRLDITATDASTVRITLDRPTHALLHLLAHVRLMIVDAQALADTGGDLGVHPAGTGPFRVISWVPDSGLVLVRNPTYWQLDATGTRLPYLDRVDLAVADAASPLYAEGRLDVTTGFRAEPPPLPGGTVHHRVAWFNTIYLGFNFRSQHPVVQDRALRAVVGLALPRPEPGIETIHQAASGLLPPGLSRRRTRGQRTDLAAAQARLDDAGRPEVPTLRVAWLRGDGITALRVQEALETLGWPVALTLYPSHQAIRDAVEQGQADLFRHGWLADYPDPHNFLSLFQGGSGNNWGAWQDPNYDAGLAKLATGLDESGAAAAAQALEQRLLDDVAAVFLRHEVQDHWVSARITGWRPGAANALNRPHLARVQRLQ